MCELNLAFHLEFFMSVTQKQIAERVGISRPMVALALSGHPQVSVKTRERIEKAAREMGYHAGSNREARALIARRFGKRVRTGIIAVLMPMPLFEGVPLTGVPFFAPLLQGIENAALAREQDVLLSSMHGERMPRLIAENGADGVICIGSVNYDLSTLAAPAVVCNGHVEGAWTLVPENAKGTRAATQHLLELGHKRIAFLGLPVRPDKTAAERLRGYRDALRAANCLDDKLIETNLYGPTLEEGARGFQMLVERKAKFSAIVCFNDLIAMGAMHAARSAGLRVPRDLSVVGFDDVSAEYSCKPRLSSVFFDRAAMGKRAVEIIEESFDSGKSIAPAPRRETFAVELRVRASTAPPL